MRRFALAGLAALAIAGSTAVYAHQGLFQTHLHDMRLTPQDRTDLADARIAAVHAGLKLTPDQEKLWPSIASAVRDFAKTRIDRIAARIQARRQANDQAAQTPPDPIARLRERADNMATTAAALKKIADTAEPLYKTLDDGQKRRLAILTRHGRFAGQHPAWRHRWMERHDGRNGAPDGGPARL
ncbi:MAG: Spy/CpxP family protein refolding chaperone [Bradyrhizobium sp.]